MFSARALWLALGVVACVACGTDDKPSSDGILPNLDRMDAIKAGIEEYTSWTPENRAKDPVGYLRWSLTEFDRQEKALEGSKLAFATQGQKFRREHETSQVFRKQATAKLEELKRAYRDAEGAQKWPAEVSGVTFPREELQRLIVDAHGELATLQARDAPAQRASKIIEARQAEVDAKLDLLRQKRIEVRDKLELAKMQKNFDEFEDLVSKVDETLDETGAIPTDSALQIQLKDLIQLDGAKPVDTASFDQIMGS